MALAKQHLVWFVWLEPGSTFISPDSSASCALTLDTSRKIPHSFNVRSPCGGELPGNCALVVSNHKPAVSCCQPAVYSGGLPFHQVVQCDDTRGFTKSRVCMRWRDDRILDEHKGKIKENLLVVLRFLSGALLSLSSSSCPIDLIRNKHLE